MTAVLVTLSTWLLAVVPLRLFTSSPFFEIDPDVVYVTNSLSYIVRHQIAYLDHPGTPAILVLAAALTPFRVISKFLLNQSFLVFSLSNFTLLFHYLRLVVTVFFSLGVGIWYFSLHKYSHSKLLGLTGWLIFLSFPEVLRFSTKISAEAFLVFLIPIWLLVFSRFIQNRSKLVFLLSFLSGIIFAVKFNSLTLALSSPLLSFTVPGAKWTKKTTYFILASTCFILGFFVSTSVIRDRYPGLFRWSTSFITRSGIHGTGNIAFFDLSIVSASISALKTASPIWFYLFIFQLLAIPVFWFARKNQSVNLLWVVLVLVSLAFLKYPLFYYQIPNILISTWLFLTGLHHFSSRFSLPPRLGFIFLTTLLIPTLGSRLTLHFHSLSNNSLTVFEQFITSHPPRKMTLWEYAPTRDFSLIWGRSWSGEFYGRELTSLFPSLGEYLPPDRYRDNSGTISPLFSVCWDQLYIQTVSLPRLLKLYPDRNLEILATPLPDQKLVVSNHCL